MNPWKEETKDEREAKARETVKSFRDFMAKTGTPHPEEMLLPYKRIIPQFPQFSPEHLRELEAKELYLTAIERAVGFQKGLLVAERLETYNKIVAKRSEWLDALEKGAGYVEGRMDAGRHYERGTEEDLRKALCMADACLVGTGGATYEYLGALLYSKPMYYVGFTVGGIDAEFRIIVPNVRERGHDYPLNPNLTVTCSPFGCGTFAEIATGEDPCKLSQAFVSALSDEELRAAIAEMANTRVGEMYFTDHWRRKRQEIIAPIAKNLN